MKRLQDQQYATLRLIREKIQSYNQRRVQIFERMVAEKNVIWCPFRYHMVPKQALQMFLVSGTRSRGSCEYRHDEDFSEVWVACDACAKLLMERPNYPCMQKLPQTTTDSPIEDWRRELLMKEWSVPPAIQLDGDDFCRSSRLKVVGYKEIPF